MTDGSPKGMFTPILASFLATAGTSLFAFALPLMSLDDRVSPAWLGSAFALFFLARLAAAPLGGFWTDCSGPRRPFLAACLLGILTPLCWGLWPVPALLMVVQLCLGTASGIARPAAMAAIAAAATHDTRPLWLGRLAAAGNAALLLGPVLGGLLYLDREMNTVLLGTATCMLLALFTGLRLPVSPSPSTPPTEQSGHKPAAWPLLAAIAGRTLGIGALIAFYPLLLGQHLNANAFTLALIFSASNLVSLLLLPLIGKWLSDARLAPATLAGMFLSILALFSLGLATSLWQFVALGILMGLGTALSLPASTTLAATLAPRPGTFLGAAQAAAGLGLLVGPLLGGAALNLTASTGSALTAAAMIGLFLTLPLLFTELCRIPGWSRAYTGLTSLAVASLLALLVFTSGLLPENSDDNLYQHTDIAMGTVVRITFDMNAPGAPNRVLAQRTARETMDFIRRLARDLDHRSPSGSLGRINAAAGKEPVAVTNRALELIRTSLRYAEQTQGAFDPTIGAVTTLPFFFGLDSSIAEQRQQFVDWRKVRIAGDTVMLETEGMALDLGGLAKGTIIDEAATLLQEMGIPAAMVEAGGDFRVFGPREWTIGVQDPRGEDDATMETLRLANQAICTSGDYRRFVQASGAGQPRKHHILNPQTMNAAAGAVSVTVIADSAEKADALATALFVMGPDRGLDFLKFYNGNVHAQWVTPELTLISSPGFFLP